MDRDHMVPLVTVRGSFHARVIAARLGAEGMLTELRGSIDGPYPMGEVHVLVAGGDLDDARELLLADEVEDALSGGSDGAVAPRYRRWVVAAAVVALAAVGVARGAAA